ncbi:disintegrin and metalloproteinase domain-containing protein 25-like [Suncus etruscus]|uniref:disintegrin and metalloproteinase domain-containing protein 25-like n=1 Tax=Suncus etruscus TaxID=109475 RepID=UPI00210F89A8|nr:disintegrin and metalloproteinase domain-containing protein 25-like [Suncus etruscus]
MQLLLLWLKLLVFYGRWHPVKLSLNQGLPEVIIPLKITNSDSGIKSSDWVSYSMKLDGQRQVVHMKVIKHLFSRNMPVFTYTDNGALHKGHPFIQNHCYYYGYVEGDPKSQVSLNTCYGGLRGILQKNNSVYKVEPKMHSTTFEHLAYKLDNTEKEYSAKLCGLTDKEIQQQLKIIKRDALDTSKNFRYITTWWTHKRYFTMAFIFTPKMYRVFGSNVTEVQDKCLFMVTIVANIYKEVDMEVILTAIEIWADRNLVVLGVLPSYLAAFCVWKEKYFNTRVIHTTAFLIVKIPVFGRNSNAYQEAVCNPTQNCVIINYQDSDTPSNLAYYVAHQTGHILGLLHDEPYCYCGGKLCIMNPGGLISHRLSNCSYSQYYFLNKECLVFAPPPEETFRRKRCGNGVLEEGEDCDCGTINSCSNDPCCEANCKLAKGAVCAFGHCCKDCRIAPAGTLCRKQENECDLPEWCDGTSHECPEDVYVQGGISCKSGGYCYDKRCNNREEQCRSIFGNQAKSANLNCYNSLNIRGDRFGNCGLSGLTYVSCLLRDTLCGRIQCENVKEIPSLQNHNTVISTILGGNNCWSIDYHHGVALPDVGAVQDGTACGESHLCVDRHCISILNFTRRCSPLKCNMRGICNSKHNCHCDSPWKPPFCYYSGVGGSINSGPPPGNTPNKSEDYYFDFQNPLHTHICFFLLLLRFLLFLLSLLLIMLKE